MSSRNPVEALLTKLELDEYIPNMERAKIDNVSILRGMSDEKLRDLVTRESDLKKLMGALRSRGPAPVALPPRQEDERDFGRGGRGGRGGRTNQDTRRTCRQYQAGSCKYGDTCRFAHPSVRDDDPPAASVSAASPHEPRGTFKVEVTVPGDQMKWLMGSKAAALCKINHQCGTTNSKIEKAEEYTESVTFDIYGPSQDSVNKAKNEILRVVGVISQQKLQARFEYASHELEMNRVSAMTACAANLRNRGTPLALSPTIMQRLVSTMKFIEPQNVKHLFAITGQADKEKFEFLQKIVPHLKGSQVIIFAEQKRVEEMAKAPMKTARCFGVKEVYFVTRSLSKEDRYKALEAFKRGEPNPHGVKARVLVTTNDYAKLARKVIIPYVNLIVHMSLPRNKETYLLQALCAGRKGTLGVSFLFLTNYDVTDHKELQASLPCEEFDESTFQQIATQLQYDTEATPLTDAAAEPPDNWRSSMPATANEASRAEKS